MAFESGLSSSVFKTSVTSGAAADNNIVCANITTKDQLLAVIGFDGDGASLGVQVIDLTGEASITSAGNIQCDTTNTAAYRVLVLWHQTDK